MKEKVVIIGAGIAGFTCGINLLQKGYDVTIIEKNKDVGGLCFGYFVNGHYIDACFHWLMGTNRKSSLYKEWKNIGAFDKTTKFISLPTLGTFEYEGTKVTLYRNLNKTEKELVKISPNDKKIIHKFIESSRYMGSIMGLVLKNINFSVKEIVSDLPKSGHLLRSMRQTREDYSKNFEHPALQFMAKNAQTGYNNMFFFFDFYGLFSTGNADVPVGGAYYMVERIKNKFLSLGGKLMLNTEVTKLLVRKGFITGARTEKGIIHGEHFVSTVDPIYTNNKLLGKKYSLPFFNYLARTVHKRSISSCFNVYLAINADMSKLDVPTVFNIKPTKIGSRTITSLLVRSYHFDPAFIKDGKTTVSLFVDQNEDDYEYFASLDEAEYKKVTKSMANSLIDIFLEKYPEYKGKVELLSYFTPIELKKRTNTSFGSIQSYSFTNRGMMYIQSGKHRKVDNLHLCGQWIRAIGGTPTALLTALDVVKDFDKKSRKNKNSGHSK